MRSLGVLVLASVVASFAVGATAYGQESPAEAVSPETPSQSPNGRDLFIGHCDIQLAEAVASRLHVDQGV